MELTINLPTEHPQQSAVLNHPAKRKVICAGRRAGKTTLAAMIAIDKIAEGRRVLLASTTQEQADAFWDKCKEWTEQVIKAGYIDKNEQRRILTFPATGGRIKVKTAWDADSLRGDYADFLVLDECAYLAADAWEKVGAPMLLDNDGDAWFISTPKRRNWFYHLYNRAAGDGERWKEFHFTSHDNPHLSQAALAELAEDMTQEDIQQEILAQFLEGTGAVFRNIRANLTAPLGTTPEQHEGHEFVAGIDWAQQKDYTVISVGCVTCRREVALDRFNQVSWDLQRGRVKTVNDVWRPYTLLAESNSIGSPNIEALVADDIPVMGFETTASSKPPLIKSLVLAFERNEFAWLDIPVATAELEAYEQKPSPSGTRTSYSAPEGLHDDTVIARALMFRAANMWGSL